MIEDLDSLPLPSYDKLPMEKYFDFNVPFSPFPRGKRVMQIYTSRGCPVGCTFCSSTNMYKSYRARSPQNVIDEIDYYIKEYNIDEIQFADDRKVIGETITKSFFFHPKIFEIRFSADVPLDTATANFDLKKNFRFCSNFSNTGPCVKKSLFKTFIIDLTSS